ncbi:hypothetical protein [Georgenia daeguensis]|uniref:Uncharacterized protein n=1 Tax=Georgenia daeguensis TaxID=908355 RepID=A0ABP8ET43_9MICO
MPTTTPTTPATRASTTERATVARSSALVLALAWSTVGFATTDLWVVLPSPHPLFAGAHAMLEAGWGVTMTCLMVVPLLAMVVRPDLARAVAVQVALLAACTAPAGLLALDVAVVLLGVAQLLTAGIVAWVYRGRRPVHGEPRGEPRRDEPAGGGEPGRGEPRGGRSHRGGPRTGEPRRLTAVWSVLTVIVFVGLPWGGFMRTSGSYYPDGSRNGAILLAATVAAAWVFAWLLRRPAAVPPAPRWSAVPAPEARSSVMPAPAPRPATAAPADRPAATSPADPATPDRWRRGAPLLALATAGAVPWLVYVWHLTAEARSPGHIPYLTNSVDHWPQQAAAALALVVLTVAAVAGLGSVRLAGWTAGLAAVGLGGFSLLYPDVGASLGPNWGALAVVWGVGVVVASAAHPDQRPPASAGGTVRAVATPP